MKKSLQLNTARVVRWSDSAPFVLTDDGLQIDFTSKYDLSRAVIFLRNGEESAKVEFKKTLDIPRHLLFAGYLALSVKLIGDKGETLKEWEITPLKIIEENGSFTVCDFLCELEKEVAEVKKNQEYLL